MDTKNNSSTGLVKVSRLSNTRASQCDPRIAYTMFHKISAMYRELKHQDILQSLLEIQKLKFPVSFSSPLIYQPTEPRLPVKLQEVPSDLQDIQPRPSKVWNCDNIYLIQTVTVTRWYAHISYSWVTGCGVPRLVRQHHYGAQRSYLTALVEIISSPLCCCTKAITTLKIYITIYPVIGQSTIHRQDIWIVVVGINLWPIFPPCVPLLP